MSSFPLPRRARGLGALSSVLAMLAALLLIGASGASAVTSGTAPVVVEDPCDNNGVDGPLPDGCVTVTKTNDADGDGIFHAVEVADTAGAAVPFKLVITNAAHFDVVVDSILDSVDGGPATAAACAPLVTIVQSTSSTECTFNGTSPADGTSSSDVATVNVHKASRRATAVDSGSSTVLTSVPVAPTATVTKTNDANGDGTYSEPETAVAAGLDVPFRLHVVNSSDFPVQVVGVQDSDLVNGEFSAPGPVAWTCASDLPIAAGGSVDCFFTRNGYSPADGASRTDKATVSLIRSFLQQAALRRSAAAVASTLVPSTASTVTTHVPVVVPPVVLPTAVVTKTNNADQSETPGENFHASETATSVGADVRFRLHVANASAFSVDVSSVTDQVTGGPVTSVSCLPALTLAANSSGDCFYTLPGYTPGDGVTKTNVATVYLTKTPVLLTLRRFAAAVAAPAGTPVLSTSSSVTTHLPSVIVPVVPVTPVTPTPPLVVAPVQDLGVAKSGPGAAHPGDELVWTIDVTNVKGTPATGFTVTDALPAGTSYSSAEGTGFVCTQAAAVISCTYTGSLAVGDSAHVLVRALLLESFTGTTVVNTAVVDPGRSDETSANNSATVTTAVTPAAPAAVDSPSGPVQGSGGGEAAGPVTAPQPPSAEGSGLPFTGWATARTLQVGLALLLAGLLLSLAARARRLSR
ncbi:MAG: large repetitive protein [Actinomycetota bacterium]|nr:large repetitive protein [Actinomycetota bacterium]